MTSYIGDDSGKHTFTIEIQTDPDKTLSSGTTSSSSQKQTFKLYVTDDYIAGMLCLARLFFGKQTHNHIRIYLNSVSDIAFTSDSYLEDYFICEANLYIEYDPNVDDWYDYINTIAMVSDGRRIPFPIFKSYSCRFKTPTSISIYQFETSNFLDGVKKVCSIFSYSVSDYLDMIHLGDSFVEMI